MKNKKPSYIREHRFELMLELMKSQHRAKKSFRTKKQMFHLAVEAFYQFYFYCLGNEITITLPECI